MSASSQAPAGSRLRRSAAVPLLALAAPLVLFSAPALALPSFARQTGLACSVCHVSWPELTEFGRQFKLRGYTLSIHNSDTMALAALVQVSSSGTRNTAGADPSNFPRNNSPALQQASLFYGGRLTAHSGAFVQYTYDGVAHHSGMDNTDLRAAGETTVGGKDLVYGATLNNNPSVQDLWNTTPAWTYPFAASSVAVTPAASALLDGGLAAQVGGLGVYADWNQWLYGEIGLYRTAASGFMRPLGHGTDFSSANIVAGNAPYGRLAMEYLNGDHALMAGVYGLSAGVYPDPTQPAGATNHYRDLGVDAQYQYVGETNAFSLQATRLHEQQDLAASYALGDSANPADRLTTTRIRAGYYYDRRYGASASWFQTTGSADSGLYGSDPVTGSFTGSPNSRGYTAELDYLPVPKVRFALQYTGYTEFNGASQNYDGAGRNAHDNDTLYLVGWFMF